MSCAASPTKWRPARSTPSPSRSSTCACLKSFSKRIEGFRIPVIAGIWPLTSLRNAEFMKNDLRVSMPEEIMLRMAQADTPDAARQEGIKIAQEMLEAVRPLVQGVQVSAPFGRYTAAAEVIASVLPKANVEME